MTAPTFTDHRGVPLAVGDRIIPIGWGEIPLWLVNTRGTIVKFGRKRLHVRFDGVRYDESLGDKPHTLYPTSVRRLDDEPATACGRCGSQRGCDCGEMRS